MKYLTILIFTISLTINLSGQQPKSEIAKSNPVRSNASEKKVGENDAIENAIAQSLAPERIRLLQKFIEDYPKSKQIVRAQELISSSRAELADEKLRLSEVEAGIELFKLAVIEAPVPVSDKLFSGLLIKFPANLYFRGQREAAIEVAKLIEQKTPVNPNHLLGLATFYLTVENASEARRLAEKSIDLNPGLSSAYHTLGYAHRLNFDLEKAAQSFLQAMGSEGASPVSKVSLAEMKRALGKPREAITLYREVLELDPSNSSARTGLILSLFDSGQKELAETELAASLDQTPNNMALLVGAAYWYAANNDGAKAIELAQKVLAFEPRYTWTYIALARGHMALGDPISAERTLLTARQYGNFPTLEYELASSRQSAGFYREAAEGLRNSFVIENGLVKTKLGGRVETSSESFSSLLSLERRASIFQFSSADSPEESRRMKNLLRFAEALDAKTTDASTIESAADEFIAGNDPMKTHRQLFAANQMLQKKRALPKVLKITRDAVSGVDAALNVRTASAAVLADELYESRKIAVARGQTIIVPNISRQTLSRILRGRIEEIAGWAFFEQSMPDEALQKLRLATTVVPEDSAWSRSTYWRLGSVLESSGKSEEALDAYIRGYSSEEQNPAKKLVIEGIYGRLYGSLDGLEERLQKSSVPRDELSIFKIKPEKETISARSEENADNDGSAAIKTPPAEPANPGNAEPEKSIPPAEITFAPLNSQTVAGPKAGAMAAAETGSNKKLTTAEKILDPTSNISILPEVFKEDIAAGASNVASLKPADGGSVKTAEPIFEPAVIKLPEAAPKNPVPTGAEPPVANSATPAVAAYEFGKPLPVGVTRKEIDPVLPAKALPQTGRENIQPERMAAGLVRPRIVPEEDLAEKSTEKASVTEPCELLVSQNEMTIIGDGGSLGLLVGYKNGIGDLNRITAVSNSPGNISVAVEPVIGLLSAQAFFIVKSISTNTGIYNVAFDSPCGKKIVTVKVR